MKIGRRYKTGKSYAIRHRKGRPSSVDIGRSLAADRREKVSGKRIPRTRTGNLRQGYGHKGDYRRKIKKLS